MANGSSFRVSPENRVKRSLSTLTDLANDMQTWANAGHLTGEYRPLEDGRSVDLLVRLREQPPIEDYSFRLSEALHQARSALDGLAWELSHQHGAVPKKERELYFPALDDATKWSAAAKRLVSMPADVLDRIEKIQPYHSLPATTSFISVLSRLSNQDKHRDLIIPNLAPGFLSELQHRWPLAWRRWESFLSLLPAWVSSSKCLTQNSIP